MRDAVHRSVVEEAREIPEGMKGVNEGWNYKRGRGATGAGQCGSLGQEGRAMPGRAVKGVVIRGGR